VSIHTAVVAEAMFHMWLSALHCRMNYTLYAQLYVKLLDLPVTGWYKVLCYDWTVYYVLNADGCSVHL